MTIKSLELETVCGITSKLPQHDKIEMAFWGRSNVGKSSLLNTLWNRKSMARISSQPGKTQTINYYNINDLCYMVDLPGYGYAKISKEIRHEPTAKDVETYQMLFKKGFNPLIIATKADKIKKNVRNKNISIIRKKLGLSQEVPVIPFSSATKEGKDEVWEYIEFFLNSQLL